MSEGWDFVELGSVAKVQGGFAFKSKDFTAEGVPVAKIKNIKALEVDLSDCGYVNEETAKSAHRYFAQLGDVLISMTGSGANAPNSIVGRVARNHKPNNFFLLNQRVGRVNIIKPDKLDQNFLYYYLSPKRRQWELVSIATGSANQVNISGAQIESLIIPLPSIEKQQRIGKILNSLDDKIHLLRQQNATLASMAQALFKSWFVDFDPVIDHALAAGRVLPAALAGRVAKRKAVLASGVYPVLPAGVRGLFPGGFVFSEELGRWVPEGWAATKFNEYVDVKYGKDHKKLDEGPYPVYGSGGLMRRVDTVLYDKESVLIPRKGTLSNVMYVNEPFWSVDTMFYTILKRPNLAKYVFYFISGFDLTEMNVGSAVPSMTTAVLNSLDMLVPSGELLELFDDKVEELYSKKQANAGEIETLTRLRDVLLPELISGRLVV